MQLRALWQTAAATATARFLRTVVLAHVKVRNATHLRNCAVKLVLGRNDGQKEEEHEEERASDA